MMKSIFSALFLLLCVLVNVQHSYAQMPNQSGITVLELFTTQGCPSCPPADRIFENVVYEFNDDPNLIALSCHVTYFDRKGWRDRLSAPFCDHRHKTYFMELDLPRLYTPQMIVNGKFDLIGNKPQIVYDAIAMGKSLKTVAPITLRLHDQYLDITLPRIGLHHPVDVWMVSYKKREQTIISGGGNRGEVINYMNVIQDFKKLLTWDGYPINMAYPINTIKADGFAVVAQVQNQTNIIAAGKAEFAK
jgi:hypothetical protein